MSAGLGIRPSALPAWIALHRGIADNGPTPCADDAERWVEPITPAVAEWAAHHCTTCPVNALCNTFAIANREVSGIWAGRSRTPNRGRPAAEPKEQTG